MNQLPYEPADLTDCEGPEECFYDKLSLNNNHFERVMSECLESNPNVEPNTLNEALYSFRENMEEYEPDCYWYHPDHLGSSSWITYSDGSAVQHLHYLPWGEDFVDQRTTNWNARHTFSAKEKDTETGLSYFGSRYYSSDLSIWLSVDPMSDKYPSLSPYTYCANNPIKIVDPDGCFGVPIHQDVTRQAINKTNIKIKFGQSFCDNLIKGVKKADHIGFAADWHFDNRANYSEVKARWNSLNRDIAKTIGEIGRGNVNKRNTILFGKMLHNVQDFYAHSNYAELYVEYYQDINNGELPTSLPTFDEGIKDSGFNQFLKGKLRTGDFHLLDNEKFDINPFREHADEPTSHNKMNKDNADTYVGQLAKQAALEHTVKILNRMEK
jgi:RHS repeat-associated protein